MTTKRPWARPEITPLTDTGARSDAPDVAVRNGTAVSGVQ
jgi:hypothetical protein